MSRPSLTRQVELALSGLLTIGESRHAAKREGTEAEAIFSWGTFHTFTCSGKR